MTSVELASQPSGSDAVALTVKDPTPSTFLQTQHEMTLVFKNLCKEVPLGVQTKGGEPEMKQILFDVSGVIKPREVVALMGPSGSGKTTLLNVLGGRALAGVSGEILMNNRPLTKSMKRIIAYVLQEDIFYVHLTVREQLTFTAQLRLPETIPAAQRMAQVEEVMQRLNVIKCANTPIMLVSGGEKKRTNIGTELLTNPSVILLDEPTSGLDSTTAAALMSTLRDLANSGKTVISSIHQPSSHIFYSFDKLIVLADGHMVFNGTPRGCMPYLATKNYVPPGDYNPADFLMDLVTSYDIFVEKYDTPPRQVLIESWDNSATLKEAEEAQASLNTEELADPEADSKIRPTSYITQLKVLLHRSQKHASSQLFTGLNFIQCFGVAIISGLMWFRMDNTEDTVRDRSGFMFFFMTYWLMNACFSGMRTFPPERLVLLKERSSGSYQLSAFFIAKSLSEAPIRLLLPFIYIIISYWMGGLNPTARAFIGTMGTELLVTLTGESIGLFIGTATMELENSMVICALTMLTMMLVGGFFVDNVKPWIDWLKYLSVFKYAYDATLQFEFPPNRHVKCTNGDYLGRCATPGTDYVTGSYVTDQLGVEGSVGLNIGVLVLMLVFYRVGAYLFLRFLKHNQGRQ